MKNYAIYLFCCLSLFQQSQATLAPDLTWDQSGINAPANDDYIIKNTVKVLIGDIDALNEKDIIVVTKNGGTRVFLNTGSSAGGLTDPVAFDDPNPNTAIATGNNATDAALADLNNDGRLDLFVTINGAENEIWLNDGTAMGTFTKLTGTNFGNQTSVAVILKNIDGDNDIDIIIANNDVSEQNEVWLNNGATSPLFTLLPLDLVSTSNRNQTNALAIADFNNDGFLDIYAGNEGEDVIWYQTSIAVFDNGTNGGLLYAGVTTAVVSALLDDDPNASGPLTADLFLGTPENIDYQFCRNNGSLMDSNFQNSLTTISNNCRNISPSSPLTTPYTTSLVTADVNNDGFIDIIAGNKDVSGNDSDNELLLNNINTLFQHQQTLFSNNTPSIAVADFGGSGSGSGTGLVDLVAATATGPSYIYYGHTSPDGFLFNKKSDSQASVLPTYFPITAVGAANSDHIQIFRDEDTTYLFENGRDKSAGTRYWKWDDGLNRFNPGTQILPTTGVITLGTIGGNPQIDAILGNQVWFFDFVENQFKLQPALSFLSTPPNFDLQPVTASALTDIDNDADADLFIAFNDGVMLGGVKLLTNNLGIFTEVQDFNINGMVNTIVTADFDNDGDQDVIFAGSDSSTVFQAFLNNGSGSYIDATGQFIHTDNAQSTLKVKAMMINSDNAIDYIILDTAGQIGIYLNNNTNPLGFTATGSPISVSGATDMDIGDVDNDGDYDIFVSFNGVPNKIFINDGAGNFTVDPFDFELTSNNPLKGNKTVNISAFDLNRDGLADLTSGNLGANRAWIMKKKFIVSTPTSTSVLENGTTTSTFKVSLTAAPNNQISIALSTSDATEGTVSPATLMIDDTNWETGATVTVTAVNDNIDDGNLNFNIIFANSVASADPDYDNQSLAALTFTNIDNNTAALNVTTSGQPSEAGGAATITVVLATEPLSSVIVSLSNSNTSQATLSASSLSFDNTNWNIPQLVTVTGVNNSSTINNPAFMIDLLTSTSPPAPSGDPKYDGLTHLISLTTLNDDSPVVINPPTTTIAAIIVNQISTTTNENGTVATFSLALNAQPSENVTIPITSNNPLEGIATPASVIFTPANWDQPQIVTVMGVDDMIDDGNQDFQVVIGAAIGGQFNGVKATDLTFSNLDNDTNGFSLSSITGTTDEEGRVANFTLQLTAQPKNNIVVRFTSEDPKEGTISPAQLTFTTSNWNIAQSFFVTGIDDGIYDENQIFKITSEVIGGDLSLADITITNIDKATLSQIIRATPEIISDNILVEESKDNNRVFLRFDEFLVFLDVIEIIDTPLNAEKGVSFNNDGQVLFGMINGKQARLKSAFADRQIFEQLINDFNLELTETAQERYKVSSKDPAVTDWFSIMPDIIARPSLEQVSGIYFNPYPTLEKNTIASYVFEFRGVLYEQFLIPMPAYWEALKLRLNNTTNPDAVFLNFYGVIDVKMDQGAVQSFLPSYDVRMDTYPIPPNSGAIEIIYGQHSHQLVEPLF